MIVMPSTSKRQHGLMAVNCYAPQKATKKVPRKVACEYVAADKHGLRAASKRLKR